MRPKIAFALVFTSVCWGQQLPTTPWDTSTVSAFISAAQGTVNVTQDTTPWALSAGDSLAAHRTITTGPDGYARFEVAGRASFEVYGNSRVVFRRNSATPGDLLDVVSGRVRVHFNPGAGEWQQRVFCRVAIVTARTPATIALATDEDNKVRVDVLEGEVAIQHALHPRNEPTIVKAIDAIEVERDEQISRRVDRGSLYRYTVKPWHDLMEILTAGRSHPRVQEQPFASEQLLAGAKSAPALP